MIHLLQYSFLIASESLRIEVERPDEIDMNIRQFKWSGTLSNAADESPVADRSTVSRRDRIAVTIALSRDECRVLNSNFQRPRSR